MNYLYNGVELPDINEVWDKEKYPYAMATDGGVSFFSAKTYVRGSYGYVEEDCECEIYMLVDGVYSMVYDNKFKKNDIISNDTSSWSWSNFNILNEDGSIFLEASEPIPVAEKQYFLYNGIELPDINTVWTDKETYPYAYISTAGGLTFLNISSVAPTIEVYNAGRVFLVLGNGIIYDLENGWSFEENYTINDDIGVDSNDNGLVCIWSNIDLVNTDGSVYLAGSEPVPADEKYFIQKLTLQGIADSIRAKKGTTDTIPVPNFASEIDGIETAETRTTTALDFTNYNNGSFTETLSDGSTVNHTVTIENGVPTQVDDITISGVG